MTYQNIQFAVQEGGVARLTLNRPDKLNSFNGAMHAEMRSALATVQEDKSIRVLVITGAGRGFCAGQDLADPDMALGPLQPDIGNVVEQNYKPLVLGLQNLRVPTVAMVNAKLVLLLANHVGDITVLREAMRIARQDSQ